MPEKVAVVYFSQTGNTEKVAQAISRGLEATGAAPEPMRLESTGPSALARYDFFGLGAPSFYFKLPFNVKWFMKAMPRMEGRHAFGFLTDGSHPGLALPEMKRRLARRDVTMVDSFRCLGVDTYPPFIGAGRQAGHPDSEELASAEAFGRGLMARRDRIKAGAKELVPHFPFQYDKFATLGRVLTRPMVTLISPIKHVNAARCTRCGICAKQCPTKNIRLEPTPKFAWRCVYCYWCQRICPAYAIECDWTRMKRRLRKTIEDEKPSAPQT